MGVLLLGERALEQLDQVRVLPVARVHLDELLQVVRRLDDVQAARLREAVLLRRDARRAHLLPRVDGRRLRRRLNGFAVLLEANVAHG